MLPVPLARLVAAGPPPGEAIDRFFAEHEFPLLTARRAPSSSAAARRRGRPQPPHLRAAVVAALRPARGTDLCGSTLEIPQRSRVEYKLEVVTGDEHRLIEDPLNPRKSHDPFGTNSVAHGPGYETPEWTRPPPRRASARSTSGHRECRARPSGAARALPAGALPAHAALSGDGRPHDGGDYLNYAGIKTVLDNLIHRLEMAETSSR